MSSNRRNSRPRVEEFRRKNTTRSAPQNPPQISAATPQHGPIHPHPPDLRPTSSTLSTHRPTYPTPGNRKKKPGPGGRRRETYGSSAARASIGVPREQSAPIGVDRGRGREGAARRRLLLCPLPTAPGVLECIEEERREVETRKKMRDSDWVTFLQQVTA